MLLGQVEVDALDINPYQGANIIHNLTEPLPATLRSKYGLIIDAGTLEHILNPVPAMDNLIAALRPGGVIVHMSPSAGYVDHGYFQFSPLFFTTYYQAKGMSVSGLCIVEQPVRRTNHCQWRFWIWDAAIKRKKLLSMNPLSTFCSAKLLKNSCVRGKAVQDFSGYLRAITDHVNESKPWGLRELTDLRPKPDYPLE